MEKDDEITGSTGSHYDLGLRMFDTRLGRMFARDPRETEYPWQSTYAYYRNSPISTIDHLGGGGKYNPNKKHTRGSLNLKLTLEYNTGTDQFGVTIFKKGALDVANNVGVNKLELKLSSKDFFSGDVVSDGENERTTMSRLAGGVGVIGGMYKVESKQVLENGNWKTVEKEVEKETGMLMVFNKDVTTTDAVGNVNQREETGVSASVAIRWGGMFGYFGDATIGGGEIAIDFYIEEPKSNSQLPAAWLNHKSIMRQRYMKGTKLQEYKKSHPEFFDSNGNQKTLEQYKNSI